ncbi:MAG: hypothetical protein LBT49_06500 [Prevotellaceae bacterium]|jgi:hypothetical protein|nr:hypothetical protein [Prevotellaceae bacterium]
MHRKPDYIPRADAAFHNWAQQFITHLGLLREEVRFPEALYAELAALQSEFSEKLDVCWNPKTRTSVSVFEKDAVRDRFKRTVRQAVNAHLSYNSLLTGTHREMLGLPIRKTTRTRAHQPDTTPIVTCRLPGPAMVEFHFRNPEGRRWAKPAGTLCAEFAWGCFEERPVDWEALPHRTLFLHTPGQLTFKSCERGLTLYFAIRWVNTRGEPGPWSEIKSVIIP